MKLKEEYYKPRDLAEDEQLENIIDAILKQKAMAMDTGYVADVCITFNAIDRSVTRVLNSHFSLIGGEALLSFPKFRTKKCWHRCFGFGHSSWPRSWFECVFKILGIVHEKTHSKLVRSTCVYQSKGKQFQHTN